METSNGTSNEGLDEQLIWLAETQITLGAICIGVVVANLILILVIARVKSLHNVPNYLILALSVSDLLVGSLGIPLYLLAQREKLGKDFQSCLLGMNPGWIGVAMSENMFFVVTAERYMAVCHPIRHRLLVNQKRVGALVLGSLVYSLLTSLLPVMGWNSSLYISIEYVPHCDVTKLYVGGFVLFMGIHSCMFFTANIIMLVRMYLTLRRINRKTQPGLPTHHGDPFARIKALRARRRSLALVLFRVCYHICSWLPVLIEFALAFDFFQNQIGDSTKLNWPTFNIFMCIGFSSSCVCPVLYMIANKDIRLVLYKIIKREPLVSRPPSSVIASIIINPSLSNVMCAADDIESVNPTK